MNTVLIEGQFYKYRGQFYMERGAILHIFQVAINKKGSHSPYGKFIRGQFYKLAGGNSTRVYFYYIAS